MLEANCGVPEAVVDPRTSDGSKIIEPHCGADSDGRPTDRCRDGAGGFSRNIDGISSSLRSISFFPPPTQLPPPAIDRVLKTKASAYAFDKSIPDPNALDVVAGRSSQAVRAQWVVPHLLNGWVSLEGFGIASYFNDALGWVHLDGA